MVEEKKHLPSFDELPHYRNFSGCAWGVWGPDDQLGTVNLLTDDLVRLTAQEEIKTGRTISLNWPVNFPEKPLYNRQSPCHESFKKGGKDSGVAIQDDILHINTQSGTQWDGMKHFGVLEHGVYYNNTSLASLHIGHFPMPDPSNVDPEVIKLGIHNWAQHGICGRGVLLDLVKHFTPPGADQLPYDPWAPHPFSVDDLRACAEAQGVEFRRGDILILRAGWIRKYVASKQEDRDALAARSEKSAGIEQSEDMKRFLWDNHFAAAASDQPALERWPPEKGIPHLHQTILGLWGMPIGEFFDLEALAAHCAETGRYTFFFSSWPLNVLGGVASPPNAAAYF